MAEKTIGVDIEEDLHEKARLVALKRKVPVKTLYSQGLLSVLGIGSVQHQNPYAEANRILHDKLERILNSGDTETLEAVIPNIELFFKRLKPSTKRRAAG
jgi:hypothetical protein